MNHKTVAMVAMLALLALPALAGSREIDETRRADPEGEVTVELLAGEIEVIAWDKDQVRVTGTIDDRYETLEIESDDRDVSIEVELESGEYRSLRGARLEISVPRRSRVEIEAVSADVTVEGLEGSLSIEAISGNVALRAGMEELEISCVSGNIEIEATRVLRRAEIESVSGNVDFRGPLADRGRYSFESVTGNLTLRLPAGTSAQFDVETFNGDIDNELGPAPERTSDYLPAKELSFTLGGGDARVTVESFGGKIRLLKD